jgi:hypothetical protein
VESRVGGEEGGAVGDGAECALFVFLHWSAFASRLKRRKTYLPFGLGLHDSMGSLGSKCEEIGGAIASLERVGALDLFSRNGSDGSRVDASETCSGIPVQVSGTTGGGSDWGRGGG